MLDDFKDNQFCDYAKNLTHYFHAYLFEVDDLEESYPLILAFAKTIICKEHYKNLDNCSDCNICNLIDKGYYEGLITVSPDGAFIKKNDINELQQKLSLKSSDGLNQVYIIKNAEKLNASSANSLLKFIEEPAIGVHGILITTDRKQIIPTILSRCNLISLKSKKEEEIPIEDAKILIDFIDSIHKKKEEIIPDLKELFLNYYATRENILNAFNLIEKILDLKIQDNLKTKKIKNQELYDIIKASFNDQTIQDLTYYLEKIVEFKNKLITIPNININLFMDHLAIEMSRYEVV